MDSSNRKYALALIVGGVLVYAVKLVFTMGLAQHGLFSVLGGYNVPTMNSSLPESVAAHEACLALKHRFFDHMDESPEHVLQSSRHHWKQLNCADVLAQHRAGIANTLTQVRSTPAPVDEVIQDHDEPESISAHERAIREEQESYVRLCYDVRVSAAIIPGKSWGKATKAQKKAWADNKCDKYGSIKPGVIHSRYSGSLHRKTTDEAVPMVTASATATATESLDMPGDGSEALLDHLGDRKADTEWCFLNREKYNVRPMKSWGNLPHTMQVQWKEHTCDVIFSMKRRKAYKMVECPASNYNDTTLPLIAVMAASTTRKVKRPSPKTMSLFTYLLPSLRTSIDCGFRYTFVMGYDEGDAYHDTKGGMGRTVAWFDQHVAGVLKTMNIHVDFLPVVVKNTVKKPGPVFIHMARAAYDKGADFFYRVNDDTELVARWPSRFVGTIMNLPPPYGVVGPFCDANKKILTHDFVHRTHMEIFGMNYYPPALVDWWMDDWMTLVYGWQRTFSYREAEVIHHTGVHGQRYEVTKENESKVNALVQQGRQMIRAWMLKHQVPEREILNFDRETKKHYATGNIKMQTIKETTKEGS
jgi:hypothetical protein